MSISLIPGDYFEQDVLVERVEQKRKKNGDPYTVLEVRTKSGSFLTAKYWNGQLDGVWAGKVVRLAGDLDEWNDRIELKIKRLDERKSGAEPVDFLPKSAFDSQERFQRLVDLVEDRCGNEVKAVCLHLLNSYSEEFIKAPAATKVHHARVGGLVEHTLVVTKLSLDTALTFADLGYDLGSFSYSALVGGAALHDMGKIREYTYETGFDMDPDGGTVGHLAMGHHMFISAIKELKLPYTQDLKHVGHIILSHHGKQEWGAPVEPLTLEALIVHRSDLLSRDMDVGLDALSRAKSEDEWTEKDWRLWNAMKRLRKFKAL